MSESAAPRPDSAGQMADSAAFLARLAQRARESDGQPPFSDQSLVDYRLGLRELITIDEVAAALLSPTEAEFVVDPDARGRGHGTVLLEQLLSQSAGGLLVWAHGDHPAARALARSHALEAVRELLHLRRAVDGQSDGKREVENGAANTGDHALRGFRVGVDEEEWLSLNARAFASHPEQGRVSRADLDALLDEPWFDAGDFLLLHDGGRLAGFCWLKVDGSEGEFYVVGVDPDHQGEGLGRRLAVAGLDRLRERGIRSAHLYVEGDNTAAVRLYRSLGFADDSVDIQYRSAAR